MGNNLEEYLLQGKTFLNDARERVLTMVRVGVQSGIVWNLRPMGVLQAMRSLAKGKSGPSALYRIHGANRPEKLALRYHEQAFTFGQIDSLCDQIAHGLKARGLAGQTIVVMMKNRPEYLILGGGASRASCPLVTISWRSTASEIAYLVNHCGAKALVYEDSLLPQVEKAKLDLPNVHTYVVVKTQTTAASRDTTFEQLVHHNTTPTDSVDEGAVVVYTSGTTGKPKGAVRKFHKELLPSMMRFLAETPFRHEDVHLACCPLYHTTAFGFIAMTYILGASVVMLDEFDPHKFLKAIEAHRVTTTVLVPTMLHRVLQLSDEEIRKYDTRTLRALFCTSAPLPGPDSTRAMELFGDIVYNLYGSTETGVVTLAKPTDLKVSPGTIGRAVPGNEIRLLDDEGRDVKTGGVGELFVKNKMLVEGYHNDSNATASSMKEGYFSVGDLARCDSNGCYHLEGRKRDMIISGGVNVYPAEIEAILESHAIVDEVAVIGVPDADWGERVVAVVVLRDRSDDSLAESSLKAHCKVTLSGAKVPRSFVFLPQGEALPRNPTGKVLKRELRAKAVATWFAKS